MDLGKVYDKVCREELRRMMHDCRVDGYLIRRMSNLYNGSRTCVRLGSSVGEYFEVRRKLRQVCVMSSWLFNIFFNGVVRQVNERATGRGVKLRDEKGEGLGN